MYRSFKNKIIYYIKSNRNELSQELTLKDIKDDTNNFIYLLQYCKKFPEFYLDPKIINYSIINNFNFQLLIEFYIELNRNELTQELVVNFNIDNSKYILRYCNHFKENQIDKKLISEFINKNFINIAFYNNFDSEIIRNINFNKIIINNEIELNKNEFYNLVNNLKDFIRFNKIINKEKTINYIFNNIYISDTISIIKNYLVYDKYKIDIDLYKKELLDINPLKKSAKNIY